MPPAGPLPVIEAREVVKSHHRGLQAALLPPSERALAVDSVSLRIAAGERWSLMGESGAGKSTLGRILLGLETIDAGEVRVHGRPWRCMSPRERRQMRPQLQMMLQDPAGALDPQYRIGKSIAEPLQVARPRLTRTDRWCRAEQVARTVGLPAGILRRYPHEISGGQRQRAAIARTLIADPTFVVFDEPVSHLDSLTTFHVINLIENRQRQQGLTSLVITHSFDVAARLSDQIAVIFRGQIVETGPTTAVMASPMHPYTRALVSPKSGPLPDAELRSPQDRPACPFAQRCFHAVPQCHVHRPLLAGFSPGDANRKCACHFTRELAV